MSDSPFNFCEGTVTGGVPTDSKRRLGIRGEQIASEYLQARGFRILERNWRCKIGEVDIVALDGNCLVFVEVKARSTDRFGVAVEAVHHMKQIRLRRLAEWYLYEHPNSYSDIRFDVIAIDSLLVESKIHHVPYAF